MKKESTRRRRPLRIPSGADEETPEDESTVATKATRSRGRHRHSTADQDESFFCLVLRVASMLAFLSLVFGVTYTHFHVSGGEGDSPDDDTKRTVEGEQAHENLATQTEEDVVTAPPIEETLPPLPHWDLSEYAMKYDAFAIVDRSVGKANQNDQDKLFWQMAAGLRNEFAETYGGIDVARGLLDRSSSNFGGGVEKTACRMQDARSQRRPFRLAFGGYSVTAGRGNYFSQSFPLVMEKKLHSIFHELGIDLVVRNAAVGGCPSFPYGWCLHNFWGQAPLDAVSWDFSMNEAGGDPIGFEAYLRRIMQMYSAKVPQLLMIDTSMATERRNMLDSYGTHALVIHRDEAIAPFLALPEKARPAGFKEWRKFGAPPGAPGQSYHHPAVKEHQLIAWVLVMHFLSALEVLMQSSTLECPPDTPIRFDRPFVLGNESSSTDSSSSILFGHQSPIHSSDSWIMNPVHCRTSFEPILAGNLSTIVVAGGVGENLNIMLPKSKMFYNQGWVLNLSEQEKKAKRNLDRFGGLGFVDSKRSYYGIFASGTITFRLPVERKLLGTETVEATSIFRSVVVCEVNEKREHTACDLVKDVDFTIGGRNVTTISKIDQSKFLGTPVCAMLDMPLHAQALCSSELCHLEVNVTVSNRKINERSDACSISHVIWEEEEFTNTSSLSA